MTSPYEQSRLLFIRRWGEMGANWGISRTMAESHALLFVSSKPLCTDDVMEQLQVSRGNASMNLRQLVNWGLIYRAHLPGDRKEYFVCETDVWQMFETITRERRRREIEPIVETIERCQAMVGDELKGRRPLKGSDVEEYRRRLDEMHEFLDVMNTLFNTVMKVGNKGLRRLTTTLAKLAK
jgi:DNA-binding transcriptional regulator GbsR (MarR family)